MMTSTLRQYLYLIIVSFVLLLLQSCAPSSKVVMLNKFQEKEIFGKKLAIHIQRQNISVDDKYNLNTFLGNGEINQSLFNYLQSTFSVRTKYLTTFKKVIATTIEEGNNMETMFHIQMYPSSDGGSMQIREPNEGTFLPLAKDTAEYVLFIDQFRIVTDRFSETSPDPYGFGRTRETEPSKITVIMKFQTYLWDNVARRKVLYAAVSKKINNGKVFSGSDLNDAIEQSIKDIFGGTPFKNYLD